MGTFRNMIAILMAFAASANALTDLQKQYLQTQEDAGTGNYEVCHKPYVNCPCLSSDDAQNAAGQHQINGNSNPCSSGGWNAGPTVAGRRLLTGDESYVD